MKFWSNIDETVSSSVSGSSLRDIAMIEMISMCDTDDDKVCTYTCTCIVHVYLIGCTCACIHIYMYRYYVKTLFYFAILYLEYFVLIPTFDITQLCRRNKVVWPLMLISNTDCFITSLFSEVFIPSDQMITLKINFFLTCTVYFTCVISARKIKQVP